MESWRVDKDNVVKRDVCSRNEAEQASILTRVGNAFNVALAIDGSETIARKNLYIASIFEDECVAIEGAVGGENDEAIYLEGVGASSAEDDSSCNYTRFRLVICRWVSKAPSDLGKATHENMFQVGCKGLHDQPSRIL